VQRRLTVARVVVAGFIAWMCLTRAGEIAGVTGEAPWAPVGPLRVFDAAPLGPVPVQVSSIVLGILALGWAGGLRGVGPVVALGFWGWAAWRSSWGGVAHDLHLLVIHALVLGLSRCDAPALLRRLAALTAATYVVAGVAKLRDPGWAAHLVEQLSYVELLRQLFEPERSIPLIRWLIDHPRLLEATGWMTIVLELGAPIALLSPRASLVWTLAVVAMHQAIVLGMGINFHYLSLGLAFVATVQVEALRRGFEGWRVRGKGAEVGAGDPAPDGSEPGGKT
jgi:hypothetical protein